MPQELLEAANFDSIFVGASVAAAQCPPASSEKLVSPAAVGSIIACFVLGLIASLVLVLPIRRKALATLKSATAPAPAAAGWAPPFAHHQLNRKSSTEFPLREDSTTAGH